MDSLDTPYDDEYVTSLEFEWDSHLICPYCKKATVFTKPWWDDLPSNGGGWVGEHRRCDNPKCNYEDML